MIVDQSHRADILTGLSTNGFDVNRAIQRGSLIPLDVNETLTTLMLKEVVDPAHFFDVASDLIETAASTAEREQPPRVGLCRECSPVILSDGWLVRALRLEQLWGLIAGTSVLDLLCGVSVSKL